MNLCNIFKYLVKDIIQSKGEYCPLPITYYLEQTFQQILVVLSDSHCADVHIC